MRTVSIAIVALLAGCPSDGEDDGGDDGGGVSSFDHPTWLKTSWDHDEGREGYADHADSSITFNADGSYNWDAAGYPLSGDWRYPGMGAIELDGVRKDLEHSKGCRVIALSGESYRSRLTTVSGCPTTPAALSAIEKCLVGEFRTGTPNGGTHAFTFEADRTATDFYDDPGYTSGGGSYTVLGDFKLLGNGDVEFTKPGGDPEARTAVVTLADMTRTGPVATGCDMAGFTKLARPNGAGGEATCSLACGTGYACAEYEGIEACCATIYPNYCPDVHACYSTAAARDEACTTSYYGDPAFGCEGTQTSTTIGGAAGSYCAPSCNGSGSFCPSSIDGAAGACAIGSTTATRCALRCTDIGTTGGQCPNAMKCTAATSGNGYCLFP